MNIISNSFVYLFWVNKQWMIGPLFQGGHFKKGPTLIVVTEKENDPKKISTVI